MGHKQDIHVMYRVMCGLLVLNTTFNSFSYIVAVIIDGGKQST